MKREEILTNSERYEAKSYELIAIQLTRLVKSLFLFRKRKAEGAAASVTFFAIMSFTPILLATVSIYGKIIDNDKLAYTHVMKALKENIPNLAPWIFKSIDKILSHQLNSAEGINWFGIIILVYGCLGFSGAILDGLFSLANTKPKGGKFFDYLRSSMNGLFLGGFALAFLAVTSGFHHFVGVNDQSFMSKMILLGFKYSILPAIISLVFFTAYYKWLTPIKVRISDAFFGAVSFVTLFAFGKSFYWLYLRHIKDDLVANFGNFYTITEAVIWIYFLFCAFFFGAAVCYSPLTARNSTPKAEQPPKDLPAPPSSKDKAA